MKVIGIVGGIASGKSFVSQCFQHLGAAVLDADRMGHEVLRTPEAKKAIREYWGSAVFDSSDEVDRGAMARSVFGPEAASGQRLKMLESITHPMIAQRLREELNRLATSGVPAAVLDAPVLIKAGWDRFCDWIVFVDADAATRQARARQRGWNDTELRRREALQSPLEVAQQMADAVIENSGATESTRSQVRALWIQWGLPS